MFSGLRKFDKDIYNYNAPNFIPIACHYNENTLLTKDGKLLQIIKIHGITSEKISDNIQNLREMVRVSIKKNITNYNFAFWLHTIREKQNLDDSTPYKKLLPANIHTLWQRKNHWNDKFVNTLYISIVHDSAKVNITNFNSLINSLSNKLITDFENNYLDAAFQKLDNITNNILNDLNEFGAEKLGIIFENDNVFSNPLFLYNRIANLNNNDCLVPIIDLSDALGRSIYTIRSDKVVVTDHEQNNKFASLLSIKEYHETPSNTLDKFLQLPIELIITEIFYFVSKKQVISKLRGQDYILKITNDSTLLNHKGINKLDAANLDFQFCNQQISIAVIEEDENKLDAAVAKASTELFKLGIIHVKEDINIEQIFWSQLPANFAFIRKMSPLSVEHIASLTALHNTTLGNQYNPWGKAITLLRTEKGTPYFMNFHDKTNKGNTCIFGTGKTGKTVLLNFLISESTKYDPTIIYISNNNDSKIFIEAIEGKWLEPDKQIINPFLVDDTEKSQAFILEFLKLISGHYISPLSEIEISFLEKLKNKILSIEKEKRIFSDILKLEDFKEEGGIQILDKLKVFTEEQLYSGLFDGSSLNIEEGQVIGFNLYKLSDEPFSKQFYPTERKFLEQFNNNLKKHQSISAAAIYALTYHLSLVGTKPKIFAADNFDKLYRPEIYYDNINLIYNNLSQNNGIFVSNFNFIYLKSYPKYTIKPWLDLINTKIILPSEVKIEDLDKILGLSEPEIKKLSQLILSARMFLISKDNESIASELSIAALIGVVRILSSRQEEMDIYKKILEQHQGPPDNWVNYLYNELNTD
ncbi:VirB4 family type IV secretion/conjugal transfer ATPase [Rickettsia conorii subsp. heilongjiangensis]|uniref:VirB4 family type IV secretion/conjugal transfer ATPase n=1 Tax=Rickettsia conorii subsp. heilongjiangensis TaxID=226665 RepID=A0AAD1LT45_RICCR|nr:VirB4 family type IV secretion/conjugal transfer ATPase [Rickettsia conorii]AEK75183.1 virB4 protein precursor [Rickettsia conorii subsp. heilongjiangensis 054]BBM91922.1 VirB4 family type IV secretion/conjugal transfer ATPase [Rickettsia conorii subsp. heilongjiangensis]BBM93131.1 VirB4 family type IV secretion/conjugal transfer ATPase [Rickettsia conorii subsp. heilongjiangensis]BBM94340.1 VirB4 family type IV secretion/conjugal transfer ATPase [Rickettsia conorii subsp. heilongjiangensis]